MNMKAENKRANLIALAAAVAVLLMAEAAVRGLADVLPEPVTWFSHETQAKLEQLRAFEIAGKKAFYLFAGTSMMGTAADPRKFHAPDSRRLGAYNASLPAGIPEMQEQWLLEEVVPRLKPCVVGIGLSTFDLNAGTSRKVAEEYRNAPAVRKGIIAALGRAATRFSFLFRYRIALGNQSHLLRVLKRER
ncbi:MAG: hypothetical protein ACRDIA_07250, partial [Actinomycetota bacterium]